MNVYGQRGNQWVLGYDPSSLDSIGEVMILDFNEHPVNISSVSSSDGFFMEGSNTSICDEEGNLLFYSNGCTIINSQGEVMENGGGINPGFIQDFYCPFGGSPIIQGIVAIPAPEHENHYYVFNLDYDTAFPGDTSQLEIAPLRLYYQKVDMAQNDGLGAVVEKNQIAVQDTFARGNIQAVRQANNSDWWIVVPKSNSNCYFMVPITAQGIQAAILECEGDEWSGEDSGTQAVFSPDLTKYVRFDSWNGVNIYDFDNGTADLSNPIRILFPNDTIGYFPGVAVSPSSRFLYVCARKNVYQFDLHATDIEASKLLIAEWDGTMNPFPTIFYLAALAPDGKIYISSTSSHLSLHVIESPDSLGLACNLVQNGVDLPAFNFATIPNIPHYCSIDEECIVSSINEPVQEEELVTIYPNPTSEYLWIDFSVDTKGDLSLHIYDLLGNIVLRKNDLNSTERIDISPFHSGTYYYVITRDNLYLESGRIVKI